MQAWLERVWYARGRGGALLLPLSWLFAILVGLRRSLFRWRLLPTLTVQAPVVVVGNLTVGGSGKTPLVDWLATELSARGRRVAVVSRGYASESRVPRRVQASDSAAAVGDEPLLLASHGHAVAIGVDRVAAARLLGPCDVILADDGLQHYRLARVAEVAVIDGERGLGNGRLLPAGPLRESPSRLQQVDLVVQQGGSAPPIGALHMQLVPRAVVNLQSGERRALADWAGQRVNALAGIGHPERFFALLRAAGIDCNARALPDHAALDTEALRFAGDLPVLMTEKDAVKCRGRVDGRYWYVEVTASFAPAAAARLLGLVDERLAARKFFGVRRG